MTDQELLNFLDCRPLANAMGQQMAAMIDGEIPAREVAADPETRRKKQEDERRARWFGQTLDRVNSGRGWGSG